MKSRKRLRISRRKRSINLIYVHEYVINVFTMDFYSRRRVGETRQIPEGTNSIFPLSFVVSIVIKKFRAPPSPFMRILSQFAQFFFSDFRLYNPDICNSIFAVQLIYGISGSVFLIYIYLLLGI